MCANLNHVELGNAILVDGERKQNAVLFHQHIA